MLLPDHSYMWASALRECAVLMLDTDVAALMRLDGLSNWPRYHIVLVVAIADPPADVSELEESPEEEN